MLCAGLIFFQDVTSLKRTLDSLSDFDSVIAIDGAFTAYASDNRLSNDGSRELCQQYDNVILMDGADLMQYQKRDMYLRKAEELKADQLLVIDSDEWLEGDLRAAIEDLLPAPSLYCIDYTNRDLQHWPASRLIVRPEVFSYHLAHCVMKRADTGEIFRIREKNKDVLPNVSIKSDDSLHTAEYMRENDYCQERMKIYEAPIKERYQAGPR